MNSVCMASYNGEKYIKEQIRSILNQLNDDDELIISDDNSTDSTLDVIGSIKDKRIRVVHAHFRNYKKNFENALKEARGDFIFLTDQDDVWIDGKYARCIELLNNYDLIVTDSVIVDENLETVKDSFFEFYNSGTGILKNTINSTYFGACMAFKKQVLEKASPFPKSDNIAHDIWLGLVAETTGCVCFIREPYLLYRRHSSSLTNLSTNLLTRSKRPLWKKIYGRIELLSALLHFYIFRRHSSH